MKDWEWVTIIADAIEIIKFVIKITVAIIKFFTKKRGKHSK